jgi:hypothetical protein
MTRLFAFDYRYRNTDFAISLPADNQEDALAKMAAIASAVFRGEIQTVVMANPNVVPAGAIVN